MTATASDTAAPRLGRPPSGARERILDAATEVLKSEGYAGTTLSKVAAWAGESKALITYHFGSKEGLVAAVGQDLAQLVTGRVLAQIKDARSVEAIVRGVVRATERLADEDERIPRLYFDLAAVSVVEPEIRATIGEMTEQWQRVLEELLAEAEDGPSTAKARAVALLIRTGNQGLALERIERGVSAELVRAQELFVRSVVLAAG
jgi:AcrR family transcriptional regulator